MIRMNEVKFSMSWGQISNLSGFNQTFVKSLLQKARK